MIFPNRQLLCTFSNAKNFESISKDVLDFYNVYNKRIFAFVNEQNESEVFLTYNVINVSKDSPRLNNTILIHRKKQTNTLYTLNSLNKLVEEETGKRDPNYILDWNLFSNSLIINGDVSVRIIPLKIFSVINS